MSRNGIRYCEFDAGKPHKVEAEFLISRKDESGRFRSEMAFCRECFIVYAEVVSEEPIPE